MINFIIRYRFMFLLFLTIITIPLAMNIRYLTRDAGVSALVPEGHPESVYSERVEEIFGAADQIVIGVNSKNGIFTRDVILLIHELTLFLEDLDEIDEEDVVSLTNIDDMRGENESLLVEPLFEEDSFDNLTPEIIESAKEKISSNPLYRGKLISTDEKSAVVLAGVSSEVSFKEERVSALKEKVLNKLSELQVKYPDVTLDFSGTAMLKAFISEYMQSDLRRLFPLAILVVALLILFILRSFFGMLMPVLVTLFAVSWTFGLKAYLNSPITIVETAIPVVLIAIGCADGIHIVSEFLSNHRCGYTTGESVKKTMSILTLPVLLTSLTTGLGFLSLLSAPGVSIKNMGIFLAFGVMIAMIFSLLFIPPLLSLYRRKNVPKSSSSEQKAGRSKSEVSISNFTIITTKIGKSIIQNKKTVSLATVIVLFISVFGILNVEVESDEIRYLKKNNEFRMATDNIQKNLGGITSLDIIIEGTEEDLLKQPEILKAMEDLQLFCEQDQLVSYSLSLVDLIKRINLVLHNNDPAYDRLPNEVETVRYKKSAIIDGKRSFVWKTDKISGFIQNAQFLLLYEMNGGEATDQYVDSTYRTGRITVRLKEMSSQQLKKLVTKIQPFVEECFPDNVTVRYANHYIRVVMMDLIIDSQINSLITVLLTITILMSIMFRSIVIGLITALPVFIAILFNFSIMWMFDVTLNIGTSIIASVGMGVGIDYTIHYFTRFKRILKESGSFDSSLVKAISETSRPILSNAAAVGIGFLVLMFSEYGVIANIGWITAVSMFTTASGSLIVLPALLAIIRPKIPG